MTEKNKQSDRDYEAQVRRSIDWRKARKAERTQDQQTANVRRVNPEPKKKTGWGTFAGIIVFAAFGGLVGKRLGAELTQKTVGATPSQNIDYALQKAVAEINRRAPYSVDPATRMDGAVAGPGRALRYNYTILGKFGDSIEYAQLEASTITSIRNGYCEGTTMKTIREQGVVVTYRYKDDRGRYIGDIKMEPQSCR